MKLDTGMYIGIGTIAAAFIAGCVSYLNLVKTKDQNISQMRAQWIKAIIEALAQLFAEMELILRLVESQLAAGSKSELSDEDLQKLRFDNRQHYQRMNEGFSLVRLRLDPAQHQDILTSLDDLYTKFYGKCGNVLEIKAIKDTLTDKTQRLRIAVWKEIGTGETKYRWLRRFLWILFFGALCGLGYYGHWIAHWF